MLKPYPWNKEQIVTSVEAKKVTLSREQFEFLSWSIQYSRGVIDTWYPVNTPVYDEDAGVHTDYGTNTMHIIWANNFFNSGLQIAGLAIHKVIWNDDVAELTIPVFCKPFIIAILIGANENQEKLLQHDLSYLYESDGHYEGISQSDFISRELPTKMKKYRFIKDIIEIFENNV